MAEKEISIQTQDGAVKTFVAHPDDGGPSPVVVLYMDALGIRDDLRNMARRLAAAGYYAVLPDLYYRFGEGIVIDATKLAPESDEMKRMFGLIQRLSDDMVIADTEAILEHLESDEAADQGPKGCVGFCMGGRHMLRVMAAFPENFAAGSGLHPSFLVTDAPDSPHLGVKTIRGALYLGYGEIDQIAPVATIPSVRAELERAGVPAEFEVHPGADHGFMFPSSPAYVEDAAETSWERTLDLFGRSLQTTAVGSR